MEILENTNMNKDFSYKTNNIKIELSQDDIFEIPNIALYPGKALCFLGKIGSGRQRILRTLAGMISPISGNISSSYTRSSFITSTSGVFHNNTVYDNLYLPMIFSGAQGALVDKLIYDATSRFDLQDILDVYAGKLPLQTQRLIQYARAFVLQSQVLFIEEPFHGLDSAYYDRIRYALIDLLHTQSSIIVYTTEKQRDSINLGAQIIRLKESQSIHKTIIEQDYL
jgi:NitT/TauT family transport system ATP-binding protein